MLTECSADLFGFAPVQGRKVEAAFDGGAVTSDAGALLLGAADRAINLVGRFAACFVDGRRSELIEHEVATLVGQRVFGIALGYADVNDHDVLRHDPTLAVLAGKSALSAGSSPARPRSRGRRPRPPHCAIPSHSRPSSCGPQLCPASREWRARPWQPGTCCRCQPQRARCPW